MSKVFESDPLLPLRQTIRRLISDGGYNSVERFAHEHDIEQSILSRFLSGQREVQLSTFLKIAFALEMDLGPHFASVMGKGKNVASPKPTYDTKPARRKKVTVLLSETRAIEIRRSPEDPNPLLLRIG